MTERSVRIAISITNPVAQQLAYEMFSTTGARVDVFENVAEIIAVADDIQAVVLGLDAFPDDTFDALAALRERLPTTPIYVISAAAGQRHTERAERVGATHVIPYSDLKLRVGPLVQEIAQNSGMPDLGIRSPGWVPPSSDQGYDIESMDLNAWLSIPGNRRLMGMQEDSKSTDSVSADAENSAFGDDGDAVEADAAVIPRAPASAPRDAHGGAVGATAPAETAGDLDWAHIEESRARGDAQRAATLDAHLRREQHLRAELKNEFLQAISRQVASSEAKMLDQIDERLQKATRENAAAIRQVKLMASILAGAAALLLLAAIGMLWRFAIA